MGVQWRVSAMALLVSVAVVVCSTAVGASPTHRGGRLRRVGRPCAGRLDSSVELPTRRLTTTDDVDLGVSRHHVRRSLRDICNLLNHLYDDVNRLKTDYVSIGPTASALDSSIQMR